MNTNTRRIIACAALLCAALVTIPADAGWSSWFTGAGSWQAQFNKLREVTDERAVRLIALRDGCVINAEKFDILATLVEQIYNEIDSADAAWLRWKIQKTGVEDQIDKNVDQAEADLRDLETVLNAYAEVEPRKFACRPDGPPRLRVERMEVRASDEDPKPEDSPSWEK